MPQQINIYNNAYNGFLTECVNISYIELSFKFSIFSIHPNYAMNIIFSHFITSKSEMHLSTFIDSLLCSPNSLSIFSAS